MANSNPLTCMGGSGHVHSCLELVQCLVKTKSCSFFAADCPLFSVRASSLDMIESLCSDDDDGNENVAKQKVLIRNTMALVVRYAFWYISLPFDAKQREMTKCKVLCSLFQALR